MPPATKNAWRACSAATLGIWGKIAVALFTNALATVTKRDSGPRGGDHLVQGAARHVRCKAWAKV